MARGPSKYPRSVRRLVQEAIEGAQAAGRDVACIKIGEISVVIGKPADATCDAAGASDWDVVSEKARTA